jgi:hypothetical protein
MNTAQIAKKTRALGVELRLEANLEEKVALNTTSNGDIKVSVGRDIRTYEIELSFSKQGIYCIL